jgi:hypothetical protein
MFPLKPVLSSMRGVVTICYAERVTAFAIRPVKRRSYDSFDVGGAPFEVHEDDKPIETNTRTSTSSCGVSLKDAVAPSTRDSLRSRNNRALPFFCPR